jgi:hypothetical protein
VYGKIGGGVLCTTVVRYTARVLRGLGYRVQTYIVKDDSKTDWSVVNIACRGDQDTEPADFFGNLGCTSLADHGWFCDRRFDADVQRARMLERADRHAANALLAKLDREVTDRAIALPVVNLHVYDFVSARVKTWVDDPQFGLIVDQASLR